MRRTILAAAAAAVLAGCGGPKDEAPAAAGAPAAVAADDGTEPALPHVQPADYADASAWLCRPETEDACKADASVTVVAADGKTRVEAFAPAKDPPVDCFYVYPTVSRDETPNSDLNPGDEEKRAALLQAARFGEVCRIYAPLYRQTTLTALRAMLRGDDAATDREMAYADVRAAWTHYMANDNANRGVVLIGHDQGAGLLTRLIANEIEGEPAQERIVVAILLGANVIIPAHPGAAGGTFKEMAPCVSNEDVGCVIAYSAFRAATPPPEGSLFGRTTEDGMTVACVNPAELDGSGGALKPMLPATKVTDFGADPAPWAKDASIATPLVSAPGLLTATCEKQGSAAWLAVTVNADPLDARTDTIAGDIVAASGEPVSAWGLHLVDPNLALGNLVAATRRLAESYASWEISRRQHPREDPL